MKRLIVWALIILTATLVPTDVAAQSRFRLRVKPTAGGGGGGGSNIIAANRQPGGSAATPNGFWAATGVTGGIPNITTKCGSTLASSSSYTTINTAIGNCSSGGGGYVELGSGTFSLAGAINLENNVVLRGQGMGTNLSFTNTTGANWIWGGADAVITIAGDLSVWSEATPPLLSVPGGQTRSWTGTNGSAGTYTAGATVLNLASAPTGLVVGDEVVLYQNDEPDANLPKTGFFVSEKTDSALGVSDAISWQGAFNDHGASMEQWARVTAISGSQVTISPGLVHGVGQWQSARTPTMGWQHDNIFIHGAGVENLRVTVSIGSKQNCAICFARAYDSWVKNVAVAPRTTTTGGPNNDGWHSGLGSDFGITIQDAFNISVVNNWIAPMIGGGYFTTTSYGVSAQEGHHLRVENNIFDNVEQPITVNIGTTDSVFAYNYERFVGDRMQEAGADFHEVGATMNLFEGNRFYKVSADVFHGNSAINTAFRNHLENRGFDLQAYHRYFNLIGNAIDATEVRKTLSTDGTLYDRWARFGFRLGYNTQDANIDPDHNCVPSDPAPLCGVDDDPQVAATTFNWANYTTTGGTQYNSSEVPTGDATMPNSVPADHNLPASLYCATRPGFFTVSGVGTSPWPLTGPDVTGGTYLAGHANKTPAQLVYEAAAGAIASFNPSLYGTGGC